MRVLVGYDGSEAAQRALEVAARIAGADDIRVANISASLADETQQEEVMAEARRLATRHGKMPGLLRLNGHAARELIVAAHESNVDLLVVGSRGRGVFTSAVLGSVSSQVAAGADRPVLVVPPGSRLSGRCVIAAVDGSECSSEAVLVAASLSNRLGVPLLLAHAFLALPVPGLSVVPHAQEEMVQLAREEAEELLAEVADRHGVSPKATRVVTGASEVAAILALAEGEEAWMVAVGSRGRGTVKSAVLGSFSSALAGQGSCSVLVVPPGASAAFLG